MNNIKRKTVLVLVVSLILSLLPISTFASQKTDGNVLYGIQYTVSGSSSTFISAASFLGTSYYFNETDSMSGKTQVHDDYNDVYLVTLPTNATVTGYSLKWEGIEESSTSVTIMSNNTQTLNLTTKPVTVADYVSGRGFTDKDKVVNQSQYYWFLDRLYDNRKENYPSDIAKEIIDMIPSDDGLTGYAMRFNCYDSAGNCYGRPVVIIQFEAESQNVVNGITFTLPGDSSAYSAMPAFLGTSYYFNETDSMSGKTQVHDDYNDVYLVTLPTNATVTGYSLKWEGIEESSTSVTIMSNNTQTLNLTTKPVTIADYVFGEGFIDKDKVVNQSQYYWFLDRLYDNRKENYPSDIAKEIIDMIPSDDCLTGYAMRFNCYDSAGNCYGRPVVIIQFGTATIGADKSLLLAALNSIPKSGYYTSNDRFNGNPEDTITDINSGFWARMQIAANEAQAIYDNKSVPQSRVDAAIESLNNAINRLIPLDRVNATLLYEAVNARIYWFGSFVEYWTEGVGVNDSQWVSADNTTVLSWEPYSAALSDAQAMLESLYDVNGDPTDTNQASLQPQVETLSAKLDAGRLVNKESYGYYYQYYQTHKSAAEALLAQSDPKDLNAGDYTEDSWAALSSAWNALDADLKYHIAGGTKEDMEMLRAFMDDYSALQQAFKGLVSGADITVSFTYVNNFAAKYPQIRQSGLDVYKDGEMLLTQGHTTVQDAVGFLVFDQKELGTAIPGNGNLSDTAAVYLVYVNGSYVGNSRETIQLHNGDVVRIVRVCEPVYVVEASSGLDSTQNFEQTTLDTIYIGDSLSVISITAPQGLKVGDKADLTAALTGAYGSNSGKALSPENITLFVSEPYENEESGWYDHQPTINTGVSTDASGKLEYTFTEPGYYTVAMFNVEDDDPAFTDVFGSTSKGTYPSVYAGDFAIVYVAPAEDEAALIAQYKAEYAETAKAYFDSFSDYDFAEGYYEGTFKAQYDKLIADLDAAETLTELKAQFDADFALLKEYGTNAIDHQAIVDALREKLGYLPEDLSTLNSSNAELVAEIQASYVAMNDYTKTLLTQEEIDLLDQIAAIDVSSLSAAASVTVNIQTIGTLPSRSGNGNPYFGYPNLAWVITPDADGTVGYPVWATTGNPTTLSAKAGDHVFIRRYLDSTDEQYRMVWSADSGSSWTLSEPQTLVTPGASGTAYDGYYLVEYVVPQDVEDGSTITIQLKMISKAEFDSIGLEDTKAVALEVLQNAYDSYDLSEYDDAGKAALLQALNDGIAAVNAATTNDGVAAARKAAIAAMASVLPADGHQIESSFDSGAAVGRVYVTIENTTYSSTMYGTLAEGWYTLGEKDTMMTLVLKVLEDGGYTWSGTGGSGGEKDYGITYLAGISKNGEELAEFTGGNRSGWMGTLNDWFVNEGFPAFSVANGKLENNDVIRVMYTVATGSDIGSTWGDNDTSLISLTASAGTLSPAFDSSVTEYTLVIPEDVSSLTVTPEAANKNYQARIFLNNYNQDSAMFKRTEPIPVKPGDVIYVGVGEKGWPTMNNGGKPTKYTIKIATADGAVDELDPSKVNLQNYESYEAKLAGIDRDSLSDEGKAKYDAVQERIDYYKAVADMKAEIAALPSDMAEAEKAELQAAADHYNALTDAQKNLLTKAEVAKMERAIDALNGIITEETAIEKLAEDKAAIEAENVDWTVDQATANDAAALKTFVEGKLAEMTLNGTVAVTITAVTPAAEGTAQNEIGTNGAYSFSVELALDGQTDTAKIENAVITATVYVVPYVPTEYEPALEAVLEYVAGVTTNPTVNSVGGEWAVFALNRGGAAEDEWNNLYLSNLQDYVDECEGRLHNRKYTEYSRVVLALTSMGIDATQFTTEKGTYDLVSPLLEKQSNGEYWAEWQGNNGTAFALLALDSHNYLDNEEGNAARAAFIASLKNKQMSNGGWPIVSDGDDDEADLDVTAAAIYALAPYYLDRSKLDALGGSVSYDELKAMVDDALAFLSEKQNANGGFGSVEADCWAMIALSALGRDADTDEMFVKNGHSLLADMLSYQDKTSGGFRHLADGEVDGMATEQSAYALVAYDRYKKNQNTLYDMTDVEFKDIDQEAIDEAQQEYDQAQADAVKEKIDAIGEVTLESEADIKAARKAYDALTDEQKALVTNYEDLVAAEKKLEELKAAATQEEIDEAAASAVDKKIDAIGDPDAVTLDSEEAIKAAREAYNNLTADQKKLVKNLAALEAAEKRLEALKKAAADGTVDKIVDGNGNEVAYTFEDVEEKIILTTKKAAEVNDEVESAKELTILWQKDIVVPDGTKFPVTITFDVPKAYQDENTYKIFIYHYNGTDWEVVGEGFGKTVSAEFDSLSPGALVAQKLDSESAKTGDNNNMFLWAGICVVAVAAAAVTVIAGKKRRED